MLNPLQCKSHHLAGLLVAIAAGVVLGVIIGFLTDAMARYWGLAVWPNERTADAILWALAGAIIGGAVVYCYRVFANQGASV